jgi:hypothetical protein
LFDHESRVMDADQQLDWPVAVCGDGGRMDRLRPRHPSPEPEIDNIIVVRAIAIGKRSPNLAFTTGVRTPRSLAAAVNAPRWHEAAANTRRPIARSVDAH